MRGLVIVATTPTHQVPSTPPRVALVQVVAAIRAQQPGALLTPMELHLDSLESVRAFAKAFLATGKRLDILMCNAGGAGSTLLGPAVDPDGTRLPSLPLPCILPSRATRLEPTRMLLTRSPHHCPRRLAAGIMGRPFDLSKDGHEMQFATNHLGELTLAVQLLCLPGHMHPHADPALLHRRPPRA